MRDCCSCLAGIKKQTSTRSYTYSRYGISINTSLRQVRLNTVPSPDDISLKIADGLSGPRRVRRGQVQPRGGSSIPSFDNSIHIAHPSPKVVLRQDGIVLGQVRIEVARVQVLVRLAAVEQFLRGSVFGVESRQARGGGEGIIDIAFAGSWSLNQSTKPARINRKPVRFTQNLRPLSSRVPLTISDSSSHAPMPILFVWSARASSSAAVQPSAPMTPHSTQ